MTLFVINYSKNLQKLYLVTLRNTTVLGVENL